MVKTLPVTRGDEGDVGLIPGLGTSPGVGNGKPTSVFLPGKFHEQRSLVGYSPCDCKKLDTTELLHSGPQGMDFTVDSR